MIIFIGYILLFSICRIWTYFIVGGACLSVACPRTYEHSILSDVDSILSYAEQTIIILDISIVVACPLLSLLSMYVRNIGLPWTYVYYIG